MNKTIKLKSLTLSNFRNIVNTTLIFDSNRCGIAGKNRIGKTNTILALHWLLTDKMLDGSSDVQSIKPFNDTSLKVEVKATFDIDGEIVSISKSYQEDWVKNRGTSELTLKGHLTEYEINDIPYKVGKALEKIDELFGLENTRFLNGNKIDSKININSMLINPYYLPQILTETEEKTLRNFIVNLCGDVFDEDVFKEDPLTITCKELLEKYRGDHSLAMKFVKQQISELKEKIGGIENIIVEMQKEVDVPQDQLMDALSKINQINAQIINLKNEKEIENPELTKLKEQIDALKVKLLAKQESDNKENNFARSQITSQIQLLEEKKNTVVKAQQKEKDEISNRENRKLKIQSEIRILEYKIETITKSRDDLREKARAIKLSQFDLQSDKCPNCGYALNQDEIDIKKVEFEKDKNERFIEIQNNGKKLNLEIESNQKELEKLNQELFDLTSVVANQDEEVDYEKMLFDLDEKLNQKREEFKLLCLPKESDEVKSLKEEIQIKNNQIDDIKNLDLVNESNEDILFNLERELNQYKDIEIKHLMFNETQKRIKNHRMTIKSLTNDLNIYESQLLALDIFVKTKLKMIDNNVANVFGDIKIKLIKENIKEGSWQQICKPCIKGKDTLFVNGSTSEKITTGLAIIECVKRVLNLPNLPIIFDEGEALDSNSIKELKTDSQVITALVNDAYEQPTIIDLENRI